MEDNSPSTYGDVDSKSTRLHTKFHRNQVLYRTLSDLPENIVLSGENPGTFPDR